MKPKLLLGDRASGKTTRILETVKWLKGLVICHSRDSAKDLERSCRTNKGFERVSFICAKDVDRFIRGRVFDIVCVDEWRKCYNESIYIEASLELSKIQPVFTERLNSDNFEVEIL